MNQKKVAIVFTGIKDPMWPFLYEACSSVEKDYLFHFETDNPQKCQCDYNPFTGKTSFNINDHIIKSDEIKSVWWRRVVPPVLSNITTKLHEYCDKEHHAFLNGLEFMLPECTWVSLPSMIERARNKPLQLLLARQLGFTTVNTVFTNSPSVAVEFAKTEPSVYKSIKSPRIPAKPERTSTVFTTLLNETHYKDMSGIMSCPGIVQSFVKKAADIRVTVLGDKVFSVLIESQKEVTAQVDFRVGARHVPHLVHQLPDTVEIMCKKLISILGLKYGAIDLALMEDNSYIFFEINPNGQWGWLEEKTGLPMRRALLDILFT